MKHYGVDHQGPVKVERIATKPVHGGAAADEGRLIYCPVLLRNGLGPHHAAIYFKDVFDTLIKLCPYGLELALEGK